MYRAAIDSYGTVWGVRLLQAARRQKTDCTPIWIMRQAGRYLPEYRELRAKHSILDLCNTPELAARASLTAINAVPGLDAAILFSDILLVTIPMGIQVEFVKGEGPVIRNPVTDLTAVQQLRPVEPEADLKGPLEAIKILRKELKVPLIGFCGGPFTLASYLVPGEASRDYLRVKKLMVHEPTAWDLLMTKLADAVIAHLQAQIRAGAQIVQLFDSWIGALSPDDYRQYVLPYSKRIFSAIKNVPTIHFATDSAGLLELMKEAGGDVIGVDWRIPLDAAWARLPDRAIQGNLDPVSLFGPKEYVLRRADQILDRAADRPGHIFNLGHGILPETPIENVIALVEHVHGRK
jgi:uroporphyrinogen decarboxylase